MYNEFFGFREKPFNVTPDPRYLFLSPSHQEALATMLYGIQERRGFVSIIGEIGTGKTTLLHTLFNELSQDVKTVFIFNTKINFKQLLQNILIELELTPISNDKVILLNQLNEFLIKILALNENVALIIDEAQNLSSSVLEELRMLSNLETSKDKLLQIVLVGQPELDFKLRSHRLRQLKQRIGINCYLTPLNHEDQKKYIHHRLTIARANDDVNIFSNGALDLVCKHSKGIPRIINILCDNALLSAYGKERNLIDTDIMKEVISDYERSNSPINDKPEVDLPPGKTKKRFAKSIPFLTLLLFLLVITLVLTISATRKDANIINYIKTMFTQLRSTDFEEVHQRNELVSPAFQETHDELSINDTDNTYSPEKIRNIESNPLENQIIFAEIDSPAELSDKSLENDPLLESNESVQKAHNIVAANSGDMVSTLALKEYGTLNDTIIDVIKRANPQIEDLDRIEIDQLIKLPPLNISSSIIETDNNAYVIHMATFSSYENAQQLHNRLIKKNYLISITPVRILGNTTWYRVLVGNFSSRLEAFEFAKTISSKNYYPNY